MTDHDPPAPREESVEELLRRWRAWLELPYPGSEYPPGSPEGEVLGIDLALLDGDAAAVVYWHLFEPDREHEGEETTRAASLAALERVVPRLSSGGRRYFEPLLDMLRAVDRLRAPRRRA